MKNLLLALAALSAVAGTVHAESTHKRAGTASSSILTSRSGIRSGGMGNAFTAIGGDVNSLFHNPAGLAFVEKFEITAVQRNAYQGIQSGHLSAVIPLGNNLSAANVREFGSLGLSAEYLDYGNLVGRDAGGNPLGDFSAEDKMLVLGYGKPIGGRFSIGASGKMYDLSIDDKDASGILADVGFMFLAWEDVLTLGLSGSNVGGDLRFQNQSDNAPIHGNFGLAYTPLGKDLTLAADFEIARDDDLRLKVGTEWWASRGLALRAGYDSSFDAALGLTAGLGLAIHNFEVGFFPVDRIMIDYAFIPSDDFDHVHEVGLTFRIDVL